MVSTHPSWKTHPFLQPLPIKKVIFRDSFHSWLRGLPGVCDIRVWNVTFLEIYIWNDHWKSCPEPSFNTIAALLMSLIHTHQRQRSDWLLFFSGCQNFLHPKWQSSQFFSWHFGWISIFPIQQKGAFFVASKNHPNPFGQISKLQSFGLLSCQNSTNDSTGSGREETRPAIGWIWRKKRWVIRSIFRGLYYLGSSGVLKTLVV